MATARERILGCGGGIIPEKDQEELSGLGSGRLFGPGTSTKEIVAYLEEGITRRRAAAK